MDEAATRIEQLQPNSQAETPQARLAPYKYSQYDLDSAVEVVRKIYERGGGAASTHELATYLGYSGVRNGAFVSRLASARLFGLVEGPTSKLTVTPRGTAILQPDYENTGWRARLEAFRAIPLFSAFLREYEGKILPPPVGMQNALETKFGVPKKSTAFVLERLMNSAEQAGLFKAAGGRTKMVVPTFGDVPVRQQDDVHRNDPSNSGRPNGRPGGGGPGGSNSGGVRQYPTLVAGLLERLPEEGEPWAETEMQEWLDLFERVIRVIYRVPRSTEGTY